MERAQREKSERHGAIRGTKPPEWCHGAVCDVQMNLIQEFLWIYLLCGCVSATIVHEILCASNCGFWHPCCFLFFFLARCRQFGLWDRWMVCFFCVGGIVMKHFRAHCWCWQLWWYRDNHPNYVCHSVIIFTGDMNRGLHGATLRE